MSPEQISDHMKDLPGWTYENDALSRTFSFGSFQEAISFLVRIAFEAQAKNHHPELGNVYDKVSVRLTTHDAGNTVTSKDIDLAKRITALSWV